MASINLTGTITDSSPQNWAQAIITATLVGYANPQGTPRDTATGNPVELIYKTVTADDGSFTLAVESNATIGIPNTGYQITVQPNASVPPTIVCAQNKFTANTDISALINGVIHPPIFECLAFQRSYSAANILGPFQGAVYINTGAGVTAGYTLWVYDGAAWVELGGGGGGGGITGLKDDVLAGDNTTAATCVMVHAFDTAITGNNSHFYIETELPNNPDAATNSVGLYAQNLFNNEDNGRFQIYFDGDDLFTWVVNWNAQFGSSPSNNFNFWIYALNQVSFISDQSGFSGNPQFKFGGAYDDTGQMLGIYFNSEATNSLWQIASYGTDATPSLVFGKGSETIQILGVDVFIPSGISFDATPVLPPAGTLIDGGVVAGVIRSQAWAGFQWYTNQGAGTIDPITGLHLSTLEFNPTGLPNIWRWGFDTTMQVWVGPGGSSKKVMQFDQSTVTVFDATSGNAIGSIAAPSQVNPPSYTMGTIAQNTTAQTLEIDLVVSPSNTTVGNIIDVQGYCGTSSSSPQFMSWRKYPLATAYAEELTMHITVPAGFYFKLIAQGTSNPTVTELTFTYH